MTDADRIEHAKVMLRFLQALLTCEVDGLTGKQTAERLSGYRGAGIGTGPASIWRYRAVLGLTEERGRGRWRDMEA